MPTEVSTIRSAPCRRRRDAGFTLTELLIVMAIIVMALTLAIPAIKALTGNKSEQAAQNTLAAFLVRARTEAIGLQRVEGVLFYIDPANNRATCVQVMEVPVSQRLAGPPLDRDGVTYLDVVPDHDVMALPPGVLPMTMKDTYTGSTAGPFAAHRYLGFNGTSNQTNNASTYLNNPIPIGGVILFDPEGRAVVRNYGLHLLDLAPNGTTITVSGLGRLLGFNPPQTAAPATDWPPPNSLNIFLHSQLALVFVTLDDLRAAGQTANFVPGQPSGFVYGIGNEPNGAQQWKDADIDKLATPIFVNRYNGTLTRAE